MPRIYPLVRVSPFTVGSVADSCFPFFAVRYNPKDPIVLFCVQAGIIIILTRFLAVFLGKLRQPKVISEVIGGILLSVIVL